MAQSLPQSWKAGDVIGGIRTTAGLPISMAEFNNRRTVTNGAQRGPQCQSIIPVARVLIICVMLRLFRVMSQGFLLVLNVLMKM